MGENESQQEKIEDLGNIYRIDGTVKFHIAMTQEDVINAVNKLLVSFFSYE